MYLLAHTLSADVNMKGYHLYVSLPKIVNELFMNNQK
jgi:hypothetical protein